MNIYILFVVVKNLESIIEHYWSTTIAFLPSSHTRPLQIKAFQNFELRELQGIMQNFSYKFHSLCFLLN